MVALDQHIKFFEGNYSATAAVSWRTSRREVVTGLSMENGRPRRELGNLAILNILRHIIIVWFFMRSSRTEKKKNGQEWRWMSVCVRVQGRHHVCLIITPQTSLVSSSPPVCPSVAPPPTKRTVTRRECTAQKARATITYGLALPPLARISTSHTISRSHVAAN